MCRSIKTLHNFEPPARELLDSLVTKAPLRDRDVEASKARAKAARHATP